MVVKTHALHISLMMMLVGSLVGCTSTTPSARQHDFDIASAARVAWQPVADAPTSFQGCEWGSASYPCQPYSKLEAPKTSISNASSHAVTAKTAQKSTHVKRISHKVTHHHTLPLCQPVPSSPIAAPVVVSTEVSQQNLLNPIGTHQETRSPS